MRINQITIACFFTLILQFFVSCQYFEKNVPNKTNMLQKEINKIDWNKVDTFPSIENCDSLSNETIKKDCFFGVISQKIHEKIAVDSVKNLLPKMDSLFVKVKISHLAILSFETQKTVPDFDFEKPKIDSILQVYLINFPEVQPAIKRAVKVKTEFVLPIKLN